MMNNFTRMSPPDPGKAYWDAVYADVQYTTSKSIGRYALLIIFILGMVGNLVSFAVMVRRRMRSSSTAFYMASLALADSLVLLTGCLCRWVFEVFEVVLLNEGTAACLIVNFLLYWSFDVAVWILVIMTLDRAIVVTAPLKAHLYVTRKKAAFALVTVMVVCAGINAHLFFTTAYSEGACKAKPKYQEFYSSIWSWIDAAVYSFVPFIMLLTTNIIIIVFLLRANIKTRRMTNNFKMKKKDEQRNAATSHRLTIMLLSITCAFIVLTAPTVVIHIIREKRELFFNLSNPADMARYILVRQISRLLLYLNHSINFFLYCVSGNKFRQELLAMIRCEPPNHRYKKRVLQNSMASVAGGSSCTNIGYSMRSTKNPSP